MNQDVEYTFKGAIQRLSELADALKRADTCELGEMPALLIRVLATLELLELLLRRSGSAVETRCIHDIVIALSETELSRLTTAHIELLHEEIASMYRAMHIGIAMRASEAQALSIRLLKHGLPLENFRVVPGQT